MREQIKKLIVVISLTILIWAAAYLADEDVTKQTVTLDVSTTTSKDILVTFDVDTPASYELDLKGPAAKVADLKSKLISDKPKEKVSLNFNWNVEHEKKTHLEQYSLDVIEFIKGSDKMEALELSVVEPEKKIDDIEVTIEKLVKKTLTIRVLDKDGAALKTKTIEPANTVEMFVHSDWPDSKLNAYVTLTDSQVEQARREYVQGQPYVILNDGTKREAGLYKITLPPTAEAMKIRTYQPLVGYRISKTLMEKYHVELSNENDLTRSTGIVATDDAHAAFDKMQYQVIVEVRDSDETETGEITRQVIYNFPPEYVRSNEIELSEKPRMAKFKLVPIPPSP
ncbi:hypothetical protein LCGC14_2695130 [marine sediment metagenome]|uniref:Uncharacterized protein n=1 Tax=marine sediment metagenome TaxID=412755 RepID=A0A0F9BRV2_9ZZZZ|nr:hypothetical protein [Phycisphaerales bacterium]